jgi:hypothetical protein
LSAAAAGRALDISGRCAAWISTWQEAAGMKRWLALGVSVLAALCLFPSQASASTLPDCLARQHVCVSNDGRSLISAGQQAQLERQTGGDDIYLMVAASGSSGYNSTMNQVIGALSETRSSPSASWIAG